MLFPRDISGPFPGHSIVSQRPLEFSDVICVVATPTALGELLQCLYGLPMIMLARLRRLVGRENGEGSETRERQKKDGLEPQCKPSRNKWFRGRRRESWAEGGELPEEGGLLVAFPVMGHRNWGFGIAIGLLCKTWLLKVNDSRITICLNQKPGTGKQNLCAGNFWLSVLQEGKG